MANDTKNAIKTVKDYFSTPEKPVTSRELIDFKKADETGTGLRQLAEGILNGSYTY